MAVADDGIYDANKWRYLSEGNLHVVFAYRGPESDSLSGHVLRVRKEVDLLECAHVDHSIASTTEGSQFVERLVCELFGREYVASMTIVPAREDFIVDLNDHAFLERPAFRRHRRLDRSQVHIMVMRDMTYVQGSERTLTLELKPKWGFLPTSPSIVHDVKKTTCRFCMHQAYKEASRKIRRRSKYCPLNLFSQDRTQVVAALKALLENPQNNLKIFNNGVRVKQPDLTAALVEFTRHFKRGSAVSSDSHETEGVDHVLVFVADALIDTNLLPRLAQHQSSLDSFDIEYMYREMVATMNADTEVKIQEKLRQAKTWNQILDRYRLRQDGEESLASLSTTDRLQAIGEFLLSAALKDCSIMMTLSTNESTGTASSAPSFRIQLVDVDPKPFSKMRHYYSLDEAICCHASKEVDKIHCAGLQ